MARIRTSVRNAVSKALGKKRELTGIEAARLIIKDHVDADLGQGLNFTQDEIDWIKSKIRQTNEEISTYNRLIEAYRVIEYILISAPTLVFEASSNLYQSCWMIESHLFSSYLKNDRPPEPDYVLESRKEGERKIVDTIRDIVKEAKSLLSDLLSIKLVLLEVYGHIGISFAGGLRYYYDHATNSIETFNTVVSHISLSTKPKDPLRRLKEKPFKLEDIKASQRMHGNFRKMLEDHLGPEWWTRKLETDKNTKQ